MKSKKKWVRSYHSVIRNIAVRIIGPYCNWRYGITVDKFSLSGRGPYLILS